MAGLFCRGGKILTTYQRIWTPSKIVQLQEWVLWSPKPARNQSRKYSRGGAVLEGVYLVWSKYRQRITISFPMVISDTGGMSLWICYKFIIPHSDPGPSRMMNLKSGCVYSLLHNSLNTRIFFFLFLFNSHVMVFTILSISYQRTSNINLCLWVPIYNVECPYKPYT